MCNYSCYNLHWANHTNIYKIKELNLFTQTCVKGVANLSLNY